MFQPRLKSARLLFATGGREDSAAVGVTRRSADKLRTPRTQIATRSDISEPGRFVVLPTSAWLYMSRGDVSSDRREREREG